MFKSFITVVLLPVVLLFGTSSDNSATQTKPQSAENKTETIQKLIVANGTAAIDLDLNQLNAIASIQEKTSLTTLHFSLAPDSYFTIMVNNDLLRGALPGSLGLVAQDTANLPAALSDSLRQLVLEKTQPDAAFDLVLRDSKSGFIYFNIEGHHSDFDPANNSFSINDGRLLISKEFAKQLGLAAEARTVGTISLTASMRPIEIRTVVNGETQSAVMPSVRSNSASAPDAAVPGPDVIVGDLPSMEQDGSSGSFVGLGIGTTSCNNGDTPLDWFALSNTDHPVIPQNLYRMSSNSDRFEQIGQSWLKHAFTALENDACGFGCNTSGCTTGTHLCVGCSDPYGASLNAQQSGLGSRAWVNPFTGAYPSTAASHTGHTHTGTSHRVLVAQSDLSTASNPGATYFGEAQYVTPHEYVWCQAHPGQCNMYNNASYRQFSVSGTTSFTFNTIGSTVRTKPAIMAWTGASISQMQPDAADGIGFVGSKVTNVSANLWHYEYAVYNENLDRAIQSFSVPLGAGVVISNIGFHSPPQEPGWANDGTVGNTGFSSTAWTPTQTSTAITWTSETFAQNQNANAIRWGTLYNFRFDADRPPQDLKATVGFFKTGSPTDIGVKVPTGDSATPTPSPVPTASPTPTAPPTATPTAAPTATPNPTPAPTATPTPSAMVVSLPTATIDMSVTNFTQPVTVTTIDPAGNLIGFQGDFTFDSTVVSFQSPPVGPAGLTSNNWNVSGNVLPGGGPMKTLRISAFVNDGFTPLSGSGTLFNLNMIRISSTQGASTPLVWAAPPNDFLFIDTDLATHSPSSEPSGSITILTTVSIAGTNSYCTNPSANAVAGVVMTLSGSSSGSTLSDASGNYTFSSLASGGSYTVVPSKTALAPSSPGISTVDVVAVMHHFTGIATLPPGCPQTAADVNGDSVINTSDVVAIQRFFLGFTSGIGNAGKYNFNPANRAYPSLSGSQTAQNYSVLIFGDVVGSFADRSTGTSSSREIPSSVTAVALPEIAGNHSKSHFASAVNTTAIGGQSKLVGFQGDFTFDERVVRFESEPVQKAGLTSGNWNVSGNVLAGPGPIRTLRISAYSIDSTPLSGTGTLFELRVAGVNGVGSAPLIWAAPPNQFIFIDANLNVQQPASSSAGSARAQ